MGNKEKEYLKLRLLANFFIIGILFVLTTPLWAIILITATGYEFGKIGALGGTMGPFIAIVAAGLTFAAFYMQYRANQIQMDNFKEQKIQFDIQKQQVDDKHYAESQQFKTQLEEQKEQLKEQKKAWAIEQFENKFFEMMRLHKENVNEIQKINKDGIVKQGRQLFVTMYREFEICYKIVTQLCRLKPHLNENYNLIKVAYAFYYTGIGQGAEPIFREMIGNTALKTEVYNYLKKLQNNFIQENEYSKIQMPDKKFETFFTDYRPLHGYIIGHYYRHLYQTVKFVDSQDSLEPNDKYKYTKILRAQLTDYEQAMFYFNVVSDFGKRWLEIPKGEKYGLLVKYKMIHNAIPKLLDLNNNVGPYQHPVFSIQLALWKEDNPTKDFFEWNED